MRTRKWTEKSCVDRYSTDIEAEEMKILGKRVEPQTGVKATQHTSVQIGGHDPIDDTIPL